MAEQQQSSLPPALQSSLASQTFRRYYQRIAPIITKPKNRAYTTTILSFLVVSLFLWYAIRPTVQTILTLRKEIKESQVVNKQMEDKISALVEAQALYQQVSGRLPLVKEALPTGPLALPFLLALEQLASDSGSVLSEVQANQTIIDNTQASAPGSLKNTSSDLQTARFSIGVDGTYPAVTAFINGLLHLRRLVNIVTFSLTPTSVSEKTATISAGSNIRLLLKLDTLYYPGGNK
jgi:Tfp pilus assembly protein PilO